MLCYVTQPNWVVLEVEVDPKANGQECIDKVCQQLGIVEEDYFGLQYKGGKGENLWLNLRNRIDRQMIGMPPFRLQLRVKFFVRPHYILQESTRNQFYLQVKQDLQSQKLVTENMQQTSVIAALMAQAEFGDLQNKNIQFNHYRNLLQGWAEPNHLLLQSIATEHEKLQGLEHSAAEYRMLQVAAELQNYGMEYHEARVASGDLIQVGVGPEGVFLCNDKLEQTDKIGYPTIQKAVHSGRICNLHIVNDKGEVTEMIFKLVSQKAANALYRSVTEMHSFFRCDTVQVAVASQFSRDLKGTFASIFNEKTTVGLEYVFDIRRTCRETYDHVRRVLYTDKVQTCQSNKEEDNKNASCNGHICVCGKDRKILQEKLDRFQESVSCCVCRDAEIETVFFPCRHVTCCNNCAAKLNFCPMCRSKIEDIQRIFLPTIQNTV
ncbi:hypothetical protein CHS0354_024705 [Potamilus streckersoni]|uniref:RING-type E3 ubiquitin transferase n=1 Tax=Potamilus streckersoni TaxID=2493646 RepID=A0AAE0RWW9_9BIVA|nr:hypothetical protein CHS0354_024705 [Potamilus streckersoni]